MIQFEVKRFQSIKHKNSGFWKKSPRVIYLGAQSHIFADFQKDYLWACVRESAQTYLLKAEEYLYINKAFFNNLLKTTFLKENILWTFLNMPLNLLDELAINLSMHQYLANCLFFLLMPIDVIFQWWRFKF